MVHEITPFKRWMIVIAVMTSAIMVLLDMTIANVALPQMRGSLGATSDTITWVLTSYTMAEAVFIPLTSFFAGKLGERKLLLVAVTGFIIASTLCGQAQSIEAMVFFRVVQGAFGAVVIPLSQSLLIAVFPPNERAKAMSIFSIGILLGPILGPTVGGMITQNMDWRWVFYVNVPVGIFCLLMIYFFVHISNRQVAKIDWPTIISMAVGIGLLQLVLDQGNQKDWFESRMIQASLIIALSGIAYFVYRSFKTKSPVAPIWMISNRNLALGSTMMAVFVSALFGLTAQLPMMLEGVLNYPVDTTGFLMAPRGIAAAITLIITAKFMNNSRLKGSVGLGAVLCGIAGLMMSQYSENIDFFWIVVPSLIQGCGMGLVFSGLSSIAYTTLAPEQGVAGASIFNLFRTIGSSFGISIATTFQFRDSQQQWNAMSQSVTPYNPNLQQWLSDTGRTLGDPTTQTLLQEQVHKQSEILAFVHTFSFITMLFLLIIPLLFLVNIPKTASATPPAGH
ncbi:DHA2 family efflux MFS transporter permease subunit [Vibrio gallicus]|uniref:DHA2 family efflux MFS transporter permease subunit n=1 Tax=Vibrio gallicus TaxID=190897 RepID=UPI0021C3F063|nr:DHA2 family efflux MFS transporter permease subunit [Vibrio gallicus]